MRRTTRFLRLATFGLASSLSLFILGEFLAQTISNWTVPVGLGSTINTSSAEQ